MQTGGEISGRVQSQKTGHIPIEGVNVCANEVDFFQTGEVGYCGRSNAAGEFTIRNLGPGKYRLEFQTEGDVNYVEEQLPESPNSIPLGAAGSIEIEAFLIPGIKIEGTVTDRDTGLPIGSPPAPRLDAGGMRAGSGDRRAHQVRLGGTRRPLLDRRAAGRDLRGLLRRRPGRRRNGPAPRRLCQAVLGRSPELRRSDLLGGSAGAVFDGVDAALAKGEEVFPHCEVASACPSPPTSGEVPPAGSGAVPTPLPALPLIQTPRPKPPKSPRCKKGTHRVVKHGKTRCVKSPRKNKQGRVHHRTAG